MAVLIDSPTYGQFAFDAVFSIDHSVQATVTQHPVQVGAAITDHVFMNPDSVQLDIGMSDAVWNAGPDHSVLAYQRLREIMEKRETVTLVTRLRTYPDMIIDSISVPEDFKTMYALKASVSFQQIRMSNVNVLLVQQEVSSSKTGSKATPHPPNPDDDFGSELEGSTASKKKTKKEKWAPDDPKDDPNISTLKSWFKIAPADNAGPVTTTGLFGQARDRVTSLVNGFTK